MLNYVGKIIVSTNLAESSVTIDNIVYVIDSGFVKIKYFDFLRSIFCNNFNHKIIRL